MAAAATVAVRWEEVAAIVAAKVMKAMGEECMEMVEVEAEAVWEVARAEEAARVEVVGGGQDMEALSKPDIYYNHNPDSDTIANTSEGQGPRTHAARTRMRRRLAEFARCTSWNLARRYACKSRSRQHNHSTARRWVDDRACSPSRLPDACI